MTEHDENKEAVNFLFEDELRQQQRYSEADERIRLMQSQEVSEVRARGYDTLPMWLR